MHHDDDESQSVLAFDLKTLTDRRQVLRWLAALSVAPLAACAKNSVLGSAGSSGASGMSSDTSGTGGASGMSASGSDGTCVAIPEETAGPYPGDGTNGQNALSLSGIVRSDITSSIGDASGVAAGVPLTIKLNVIAANQGCAPLAGYAVYLWHCDQTGSYSMYSGSAQGESYLRGVQETDDDGSVTFKSIFPACYSGRWPHIHFEVYAGLDAATNGSNKVATSQLALPEATCNEVFAKDGYSASIANLTQVSLASDNVFRDDSAAQQLATITGESSSGYTATLTVAIDA